MATTPSAFLLLVRETRPDAYEAMSPAETQAALDRWNAWVDRMTRTGKLVAANPLEARVRMVSGARGERVVDGPFVEAKELVGGFFLLTDTTLEEATALAKECPNLPHGMTVEIRGVAGACHLARSIGRDTMRGPAAV
jgi:hypothetical protein